MPVFVCFVSSLSLNCVFGTQPKDHFSNIPKQDWNLRIWIKHLHQWFWHYFVSQVSTHRSLWALMSWAPQYGTTIKSTFRIVCSEMYFKLNSLEPSCPWFRWELFLLVLWPVLNSYRFMFPWLYKSCNLTNENSFFSITSRTTVFVSPSSSAAATSFSSTEQQPHPAGEDTFHV